MDPDWAPTLNFGGVPSESWIYTDGYVPTSATLQSIITLNITSTATLDLLLAGLLDNSTGGVNGTFQAVTNQVPSLGFYPSVLNTLANGPVLGQGLFKAPSNNAPPSPPAQSDSIWGFFTNAVTDVVQLVTDGVTVVESLVGIVWTATVAAFTYLDHLAIEAAAIGGTLLNRTAATLVSVGKEILNALNWMLEFLVNDVINPLLASVFGPVKSANAQYCESINFAFQAAYAAVEGGHPVSQAESAAIWNNIGGSTFALGEGVAVGVEVALGLLSAFSLGGGFLLPLLLNVAIQSLSYSLPGSFNLGQLLGLSLVSSAFVNETWNLTKVAGAPVAGDTEVFVTWVKADGFLLGIISAASLLGLAVAFRSLGLAGIISLVCVVVSLLLFWFYEENQSDIGLWALSIIFGADAAVLGALDIASDNNPLTRSVGTFGLVAGLASLGVNFALK